MTYLDYASSCPVDKDVLDLYYKISLEYYGNTNSVHNEGIKSNKMLGEANLEISKNLKVLPEEIIYTSGATESNNLAIFGIAERYKNYGKHIIISSLEHNSITAPATILIERGFEVDILPIEKDGRVSLDRLRSMLRDDTILVSICLMDSEIGIVQPIEEVGRLLKEYDNTYFHTDASQGFGKVKIDFRDVDLITISPRKFYGMNDISILVKKNNVSLKPIIYGGRSFSLYRAGTINLASVCATNLAINKVILGMDDSIKYVSKFKDDLTEFLESYSFVQINSTKYSSSFIINFSIKDVRANDFVDKMSEKGVFISAKSACCPVLGPSKLVYALTKDKGLSNSSIRVSLSHLTVDEDIENFKKAFDEFIKEFMKNGKIQGN